MRFWHSYKSYQFNQKLKKYIHINSLFASVVIGLTAGLAMVNSAWAAFKSMPSLPSRPKGGNPTAEANEDSTAKRKKTKAKAKTKPKKTAASTSSSAAIGNVSAPTSFTHSNIITTVFWVGEDAGSDNGFISNTPSAWDEQWMQHFGGVDTPNNRNGYLPAAFRPKENPFYFALPYNDLDANGNRRSNASLCPNRNSGPYSWCKNAWIAIKKDNKVAYAQWEDVGPFYEDDANYVFGKSAPKNKQNASAGLDVSPAVYDYLGLSDVDRASWTFVSASQVPSGPWKQIITTSRGYKVDWLNDYLQKTYLIALIT